MGQAPSECNGVSCSTFDEYLHGVGSSWSHVHEFYVGDLKVFRFAPPNHDEYFRRTGQSYRCKRCYHDPNWKERQREEEKERELRRQREQAVAREQENRRQLEQLRKREEETRQEAMRLMVHRLDMFRSQDHEKRTKECMRVRSQQTVQALQTSTTTSLSEVVLSKNMKRQVVVLQDCLHSHGNKQHKGSERTTHRVKADVEEKDLESLYGEVLEHNLPGREDVHAAQKLVVSILVKLPKWGYPCETKNHPSKSVQECIKSALTSINVESIFANEEALCDLVALLCYAVKEAEGYWPRVTQLFSLALLVISKEKVQGRLIEIATGEGKSCIIAMLASILALRGTDIDIVTSSPVLAERDSEKWSKYYSLFDLDASFNTTLCTNEERCKCYESNIVYGTVGSFASDLLRQEFHMEAVRAERDTGQSAVIVDEVDFMLLDQGVQFTYLSNDSLGFRHLDPFFAVIWNAVSRFQPIQIDGEKHFHDRPQPFYHAIRSVLESVSESDIFQIIEKAEGQNLLQRGFSEQLRNANAQKLLADVKPDQMMAILKLLPVDLDLYMLQEVGGELKAVRYFVHKESSLSVLVLEKGLCAVLSKDDGSLEAGIGAKILEYTSNPDYKINVPKHLQEFVEYKIPIWLRSAFLALHMTRGREYLVKKGRIFPIDFKSTGVMETNKKWSDGLQQFVEIKHGLEMSPLSLVTNFMSNIAYFRRYSSNLYGVSGTLGSDTDKEFLHGQFNIDFYHMPTHKVRKLRKDVGQVLANEAEWLSAISEELERELQATSLEDKGRAALVMCEDIKTAEAVYEELNGTVPGQMHIYTGSSEGRSTLPEEKLSPGDVIVATNLAGRGTDIEVNDAVNNSGGLLVLVTFLPSNTRTEMQAFGRTGRKGLPGSAKIILNGERLPSIYGENAHTVEQIKLIRKEVEKERIQIMVKTEVHDCLIKEEMFSRYCFHLKKGIRRFGQMGDTNKKLAISFLHEKWGLWLEMNSDHLSKKRLLDLLEEMMTNAITSINKKESQNIYHIIHFANEHLVDGCFMKAYKLYTRALRVDDSWTSIALYNRAYCTLRMANGSNMEFAQKDLETCLEKLTTYKVELQQILMNVLCSRQGDARKGQDVTDLQKCLEVRQSVIGYFQRNIEQGISKLKSLKDMGNLCPVAEPSLTSSLAGADHLEEQRALLELWDHGLLNVFSVNEKPHFTWSILAVLFLGFAQVTLSAIHTVVAPSALGIVGNGVPEFGVSHIYAKVKAMCEAGFDWKAWGIGRAVGLAIAIVTCGVCNLKKQGTQDRIIASSVFQKKCNKVLEPDRMVRRAGDVAVKKISRQIDISYFKEDQSVESLMQRVEKMIVKLVQDLTIKAAESGQISDSIDRVEQKVKMVSCVASVMFRRDVSDAKVQQIIRKQVFQKISADIAHQCAQSSEWNIHLQSLVLEVVRKLKHECKSSTFTLFSKTFTATGDMPPENCYSEMAKGRLVSAFESKVASKVQEYCDRAESIGSIQPEENAIFSGVDTASWVQEQLEMNEGGEAAGSGASELKTESRLRTQIGKDLAIELGAAIKNVWQSKFVKDISLVVKRAINSHVEDQVTVYQATSSALELYKQQKPWNHSPVAFTTVRQRTDGPPDQLLLFGNKAGLALLCLLFIIAMLVQCYQNV